ncbi:putative leucine-rich repeat domain, L domain-containing protein [Medicago truncatula]|uniref:Putative leucine-rich repeat domain, L domain-containing protein n=1 Tax=Medicago truncatula TaxID=3880 RepID=A0A396JNN2_MEDTR|nr:putative leucine-rich repeat domain, L domain-containing protein [Medicago truncatula]
MRVGIENSKFLKDIVVRPQLKSLDLGRNQWLRDKNIIMFASIFPNLQLLDLCHCCNISKRGICQVLQRCCQIRHLNISCSPVNLLEINFEVPKLEVLNLSYTDVNDETLYVTSMNCRGLLHLLQKNCYHVTSNGLKRVVENCTHLKEIDLRGCDKLNANVVASVASSRKIIALFE